MQAFAARRIFALVMLLGVTGALFHFRAQPLSAPGMFPLLAGVVYFGMLTIWPSRGRGYSILSAILFASVAVATFVSGHVFYEFDIVFYGWMAISYGWEALHVEGQPE
jgi:hypothetical protein